MLCQQITQKQKCFQTCFNSFIQLNQLVLSINKSSMYPSKEREDVASPLEVLAEFWVRLVGLRQFFFLSNGPDPHYPSSEESEHQGHPALSHHGVQNPPGDFPHVVGANGQIEAAPTRDSSGILVHLTLCVESQVSKNNMALQVVVLAKHPEDRDNVVNSHGPGFAGEENYLSDHESAVEEPVVHEVLDGASYRHGSVAEDMHELALELSLKIVSESHKASQLYVEGIVSSDDHEKRDCQQRSQVLEEEHQLIRQLGAQDLEVDGHFVGVQRIGRDLGQEVHVILEHDVFLIGLLDGESEPQHVSDLGFGGQFLLDSDHLQARLSCELVNYFLLVSVYYFDLHRQILLYIYFLVLLNQNFWRFWQSTHITKN